MTDEEFKSAIANSLDRLSASLDATDIRLSAKLESLFARFDAEDIKLSAKIADLVEENKKLAKQIGGINDNIGYHAEQFFQNVFTEKKIFGGIKYDDIILNMAHKEKTGKVEFDIVLENGSSLALIEVKNRIHPDFVQQLVGERVSKFRKYFPEYKDYDVYLGIAGFSFDKAVLEEAQKYGVGIIRQVGDGIEVDTTGLRAYR